MTRELVVIAGDGIGREVIPLAVTCLRATLPDVRCRDAEAGWGEARRTGSPLSLETWEDIRSVGSVLMGPERLPSGEGLTALDGITQALDLYAALYPLRNPAKEVDLLLLANHPPMPDAPRRHLLPEQAWAATRLGNLAGQLLKEGGTVALAHDSEDEFAHAVAAGIGEHIHLERLDAVYFLNHFPALAREFSLILTSAATSQLLVPHAVRHVSTLAATGRLLIGEYGMLATPAHGPLPHHEGWGYTNPLGAIFAVVALLRYGWFNEAAAQRLEQAVARATTRRRTPDQHGLHTMYEVTYAILSELASSRR